MQPARAFELHSVSAPQAIQRYFEVSLYLLVSSGFGILATTGGLDLPTLLLVGTALAFRGYQMIEGRSFVIPRGWTNLLTLVYVVFYLADYLLISGNFLSATVHLVLFAMVIRMFSAESDRDYFFLCIIAFLMLLAAAVLTVNSLFLLALTAFMLMAVTTFILFEMKRALGRAAVHAQLPGRGPGQPSMALSIAATSPGLVVLILVGAAAIFFLLPRVSSGYLNNYVAKDDISTGFSNDVELGRIGEIQQSHSPVMHVQIAGDDKGEFGGKWRGISLSLFGGQRWSNPEAKQLVPHLPDGTFALASAAASPARPLRYRVFMEPISSNVFFLAARARSLAGNYRALAIDGGGSVFDLDAEHPVATYEASSDIGVPSARELRLASLDYPPEVLLNDLQLPRLDPRIPPLAAAIVGGAANNYDRAIALESYLKTHYAYTLQLSRSVPSDPLAEFLFERKQGHCEYFASSMAVMLRTLRIPSRVVNGFDAGEFNDLTSEYVVRASDAHSWVEAYFPGYGWISFDPTPASSPGSRGGWSRLGLYLDAMQSFWREWVVNYDFARQMQLRQSVAQSARVRLQNLSAAIGGRYEALLRKARLARAAVAHPSKRWGISSAALLILLLVGASGKRLARAILTLLVPERRRKSPPLAATLWYERMTRALARRGWRKSPLETPREFLASINDEVTRRQVERFTLHYQGARFGNSAEDARKLPDLYARIARR